MIDERTAATIAGRFGVSLSLARIALEAAIEAVRADVAEAIGALDPDLSAAARVLAYRMDRARERVTWHERRSKRKVGDP